MSKLDYKQFTRRHRPHIQPPGRIFFVTYRLAGSIPKAVVRDYKARKIWLEKELRRARNVAKDNEASELKSWLKRIENFNRDWFLKFEEILHLANVGPMWMQDKRVAETVAQSLLGLDGKDF